MTEQQYQEAIDALEFYQEIHDASGPRREIIPWHCFFDTRRTNDITDENKRKLSEPGALNLAHLIIEDTELSNEQKINLLRRIFFEYHMRYANNVDNHGHAVYMPIDEVGQEKLFTCIRHVIDNNQKDSTPHIQAKNLLMSTALNLYLPERIRTLRPEALQTNPVFSNADINNYLRWYAQERNYSFKFYSDYRHQIPEQLHQLVADNHTNAPLSVEAIRNAIGLSWETLDAIKNDKAEAQEIHIGRGTTQLIKRFMCDASYIAYAREDVLYADQVYAPLDVGLK